MKEIEIFLKNDEQEILPGSFRGIADGADMLSLTQNIERERQRLDNIIQSADVGTWEWNVQTGETIFNERWAEIIGYTLQELQPVSIETWKQFAHPVDLEKSNDLLQKYFAKETEYYNYESRMKHKNGTWVWVLDKGKVIEWSVDGQPIKMFGTHTDISSLKRAEEALKESERRFNLALNGAEAGLWDWDIIHNQMYFSPLWKSILGYEEHEIEDSFDSWKNCWHPDDAAKIEKAMQDYLEGKTAKYEIAHRLCHKNGEWRWVLTRGGALKNSAGVPCRLVGTAIDITDIVNQREKNEKLERFFAVTPDLLSVADVEGNFIKLNNAWTDLLGYSVGELKKQKYIDFVHPDDRRDTLAAIAKLADREQVLSFVNRYRGKDGSYHYIEWRAQSHGDLIYAAARDITAKIKQEHDLKASLIVKEKHLELMKLNTITIPELLNKSLDHIISLTGSKLGYIFLCDEEKQEILLHSWSESVLQECAVKDRQRLYSLGHVKLWGEAVRRRETVIVNDYMSPDVKKKGYPEGHVPIVKFLSVPVFDRERIVAVAGVANKATDYNEEDALNLSLLMNTVWMQVERKKNEELLSGERALFRAALLSMNEGIIATDQVGKIILMNNIAEELTGWSREKVYGEDFSKIFNVIDADTREEITNSIHYVLETGRISSLPADVILIAKNGCERHIEASTARTIAENGTVIGAVVSFRDITIERNKQKQIEYLSYHDQLTGLFNRHFFDKIIEGEMERSDRYHKPLSMIVLDLDHFKKINDTWGHPVGDEVLKQTAQIAGAIVRKADILCRLGGEEFIILMPETAIEGALSVAEKFHEALNKNSHPIVGKFTASFGVAERMEFESYKRWYKRVDDALYRAKERGRNYIASSDDQENLSAASMHFGWEQA